MTKHDRSRVKRRFAKRQSKRRIPKANELQNGCVQDCFLQNSCVDSMHIAGVPMQATLTRSTTPAPPDPTAPQGGKGVKTWPHPQSSHIAFAGRCCKHGRVETRLMLCPCRRNHFLTQTSRMLSRSCLTLLMSEDGSRMCCGNAAPGRFLCW